MSNFSIRNAELEELPILMKTYEDARAFMKANGNESQWGLPSPGKKLWPPEEDVVRKINNKIQYVCEIEIEGQRKIAATFAYTYGIEESAYNSIFEGNWTDNNIPYGVIHCLASVNGVKGAASYCFDWAIKKAGYIRIDTHPKNIPMQKCLNKNGFKYCGKILMPEVQNDDILRIAFDKKS